MILTQCTARVTANSQATATSHPHPHNSFQSPTDLQRAYPDKEREPSLRLKNSQQESKRCSRVRKRIPKRHATPSSLKAIGHTGPAACPPTREVNSDRRYTAEEDDFLLRMVVSFQLCPALNSLQHIASSIVSPERTCIRSQARLN